MDKPERCELFDFVRAERDLIEGGGGMELDAVALVRVDGALLVAILSTMRTTSEGVYQKERGNEQVAKQTRGFGAWELTRPVLRSRVRVFHIFFLFSFLSSTTGTPDG